MKGQTLTIGLILFGFGIALFSAGISYYLYVQSLLLNLKLYPSYPTAYLALLTIGFILLVLGASLISDGFGGDSSVQRS